MPTNGTLTDKFALNSLSTGTGRSVLCLRLSRVNHSCNPNATHFSDETFNVKILFSERNISAGEEICIS